MNNNQESQLPSQSNADSQTQPTPEPEAQSKAEDPPIKSTKVVFTPEDLIESQFSEADSDADIAKF